MTSTRGTRHGLWRWRRNELKRRSDTAEAWVVASAWALAVIGGATAGTFAAQSIDAFADNQRATRHTVTAVLTADAPAPSETRSGVRADRVQAPVRWTGDDGTTHTGRARVHASSPSGTAVEVWVNDTGRVTAAPLLEPEADLQSGLGGTLAALGTGGVVLLGGRATRLLMERRRIDRWESEWEQIAPAWRRQEM
ncbi:hypothetical protein [Streptomyces sp. AM8-1-1]|uniref:Rv1733c family protein n=1 Tax=Streptomyces sp. AM8-1-1 TaxID=3075825 RepID=UPI0028C4A1F6|nr:hypothetical protein [Streptomyces sp. AM8-1-1]WNO70279.1 hypothetical protein RPQ07_00945 [Streptomyces sp. AM8-1-1]